MVMLPLIVMKRNSPDLFGRNWMSVICLNWTGICRVDTSLSITGKVLSKNPNVLKELGLLRGTA